MAQSVFVYGSLLAAVAFLGYLASKKNKISLLWVAVILLTSVAGLRADEVGIDTKSYLRIFEVVKNNGLSVVAWGEIGFRAICYVMLHILNNTSFLLFAFAFLTNSFVLLRFWDYREHASLAWMIIWYFVSFYFMTLNIMRQMCAVAIVFYGTRYIQKHRYIHYLLFILLGTLIHRSSVISLGFLCTELLQREYKNIRKGYIALILVVVGLCIIPLIKNTINKYYIYFNEISIEVGGMMMAKLLLFVVSTIGLCRAVQIRCGGETLAIKYELNFVRVSYILGLLLTSIGYVFPVVSRVGLNYYIYECVYLGTIIKNSRNRKIYIVIMLLLSVYIACKEFLGGQGAVPYRFVWQ